VRRHEDAQVQDPVLLGPDQFLSVEQQDGLCRAIEHVQLRHPACLAGLADFDETLCERIVQDHVVGFGRVSRHQWNQRQIPERLLRSERDAPYCFEYFLRCCHRISP